LRIRTARRLELGEPDFVDAILLSDFDNVFGVFLEIRKVFSRVVPVICDKVAVAVPTTSCEEGIEPGSTHVSATVSDGWGPNLDLANQTCHALLVELDSSRSVDVGLRTKIRLVEAQDVGSTADLVGEARNFVATPHHGYEFDTDATSCCSPPVVSPRDRATESRDQAGIVVGDTSLAASGA